MNKMSAPPIPVLPDLSLLSDRDKIAAIQEYIEEFQYNYSGKPFIKLKKTGGADHVKLAVQKLIEISLPIQCVEAVFISCYLTGTTHRHIVLAVRHEGKWGAMGLSRRSCLMKKPIEFESLTDLIRNFDDSYVECFHTLLTVYIGLPLPRNFTSSAPIIWKANKVRIYRQEYSQIADKVNRFCGKFDLLTQDLNTSISGAAEGFSELHLKS